MKKTLNRECKERKRKTLRAAVGLLAAFLLWTAAVCVLDVRAIGPMGSSVGRAAVNGFVHRMTGVHMALYTITDWLSIVPAGFAAGFGALGLAQWVGRKSILRVDRSILALGGFYLAVLAAYLFFEAFIVNYRPVLIEGVLEASYPSSTTVLVLCVMTTGAMQLSGRMKHGAGRRAMPAGIAAFTALMVLLRFLSGVHWLTDIVGGVLLSGGLVCLYAWAAEL